MIFLNNSSGYSMPSVILGLLCMACLAVFIAYLVDINQNKAKKTKAKPKASTKNKASLKSKLWSKINLKKYLNYLNLQTIFVILLILVIVLILIFGKFEDGPIFEFFGNLFSSFWFWATLIVVVLAIVFRKTKIKSTWWKVNKSKIFWNLVPIVLLGLAIFWWLNANKKDEILKRYYESQVVVPSFKTSSVDSKNESILVLKPGTKVQMKKGVSYKIEIKRFSNYVPIPENKNEEVIFTFSKAQLSQEWRVKVFKGTEKILDPPPFYMDGQTLVSVDKDCLCEIR